MSDDTVATLAHVDDSRSRLHSWSLCTDFSPVSVDLNISYFSSVSCRSLHTLVTARHRHRHTCFVKLTVLTYPYGAVLSFGVAIHEATLYPNVCRKNSRTLYSTHSFVGGRGPPSCVKYGKGGPGRRCGTFRPTTCWPHRPPSASDRLSNVVEEVKTEVRACSDF